MKIIIYIFIVLFFTSCGGGGGGTDSSASTVYVREDPETSSDATVLMDDEFSSYQWHLSNSTLNLNSVYQYNSNSVSSNSIRPRANTVTNGYLGYNNGNPIIIQVVDDGIDANHEDLYNNMSFSSSYNAADGTNDPTPTSLSNDAHGTQVAGIIGAIGYNNLGLKGVAPSSNLAGFTFELNPEGSFIYNTATITKAWFSGDNANNIAVSNNSWGSCVSKDIDQEEILKLGSEQLRDSKGRIYVFAAGNGREGERDCENLNMQSSNTSYFNNSQYSISVAAVNENNQIASYSSPGANILVSGYSGDNYISGMSTTVPEGTSSSSWSEDINNNYTDEFSGTSASAPVVSGSIALVLEACPNLTYRDIKYLIAKNSTQVDSSNSSWVENSAGFFHSNDYGFGLINPKAMIDECLGSYTTLGTKQTFNVNSNFSSTAISTTTLEKTLSINNDITIEWVGLTLTSDYNAPSNLEVKLISPSGTESILLHSNNHMGRTANDLDYFRTGGRLSSQAFMGESSRGNWKVQVTSIFNSSNSNGNLNALSLEIVGN